MNSAEFTFTCPLPTPTGDPPPHPPPPLLCIFNANPTKIAGGRAEAQARYRACHQEMEREKAQRRMQQLRQGRQGEETERIRRQASSELLRSTALFARYRLHVDRHLGAVHGDTADPEFAAAFDHFRFKGGPPFDREDAVFLLTHATAERTSAPLESADIDSLVLDFSWEDPDAVAGYERLRSNPQVHDDVDIEFMFRHAKPRPTFENMDACGCI
ncbi:hypothetical protein B0H13DRAFT_2338503 [Mycena leptocephala]|nr:hypothetical protein B0H13DRAFT_2338503 [Mycena leptocephala]